MKPKLAAILVIGLLTLSIVGTAVAAITQVVVEEPAISSVTLGSYTNQIGETRDENTATSALRFVCPFH